MSEWKTYKLSDLINVKHGFAFKGEYFSDEPTSDILLSPGNFKIGGGFKSDKFKYYKGDFPKDYILKEGDIIITMTDLSKAGDTLGYSAKIPPHNGINYLHNQRLGLVQFKNNDVDPDFLYWILRTQPYQYYIVGSATGSTVKHTSPTRICSYEFEAPEDKAKQQEIAQILSSLDDKIELNLQMNQTLEAMAQALFKEWFVNFNFPSSEPLINDDLLDDLDLKNKKSGKSFNQKNHSSDNLPKGWRMGKVKEMYKTTSGGTPSRAKEEYYVNGTINWVKSKELNGSFIFDTEEKITVDAVKNSSAKLIPKHSVLVAMYGATVGEYAITTRDTTCNQAICAVIEDGSYPFTYFFEYFKINKNNIIGQASGSAQQNISQALIQQLDILIPPIEVVKKYHSVVESMFVKMEDNLLQIQTLTQTRDTLLPKLMSGALQVKN